MTRVIISGGQTGADRAALDFALEYGFEIAGYCPSGRRAGDGVIHEKYPLLETKSSAYPPCTGLNVKIAQATVIFNGLPKFSKGTHTTIRYARTHHKKYIVLKNFPDIEKDAKELTLWLKDVNPESLNVAGNGESKCPGMYIHVLNVLRKALL